MPDILTMGASLAAIREEQWLRWQNRERVLVEYWLARAAELAGDDEAVLDLIYSEILLREEAGETPRVEEYVERFPEHAETLRRQFALHHALTDLGDGDTVPSLNANQASLQSTLDGTLSFAQEAPPQSMPLEIGGYEVMGAIGHGGMGVVYKGRHKLLGQRIAAIKVLRSGTLARAEEVARFHAEARAIVRLQHPHIVPIYEFGTYRPADSAEDLPFFVLEYVGGGSLAQKINRAPLPPRQAAELLLPLAQAIEHAHQQGVLHRDLKPANILLTEAGVPKISDFGLAKRLESDGEPAQAPTQTGAILGTPSYMAPEQASGQTATVGPAADVYALGAILYEMLTGRPPFQADTVLHTLQQVVTLDPVPPRRLQPTLPRDLETICLKCLVKEPGKRYASAAALADDLQRFLQGQPIQARPVSFAERALKWLYRHPAAAGLAAVSILAVTLLLTEWAFFTFRLHEETQAASQAKKKAVEERDEARRQAERAGTILRHALVSVDTFAVNLRSTTQEELSSGNTGSVLFKLACSYAKTSSALANDATLQVEDRRDLAEQYAVSAVKLLECSRRIGFFASNRPRNRKELQSNADLNVLRARPDFAQFLERL